MAFPDPPESYWRRLALLPERIYHALPQLPEQDPYTVDQLALARELAAEFNELLDWQVYNDAFSRDSYWLFLNHLSLKPDQARFVALAFAIDPALAQGTLAQAFKAYLQQIQNRRRQDPWLSAWLSTHQIAD